MKPHKKHLPSRLCGLLALAGLTLLLAAAPAAANSTPEHNAEVDMAALEAAAISHGVCPVDGGLEELCVAYQYEGGVCIGYYYEVSNGQSSRGDMNGVCVLAAGYWVVHCGGDWDSQGGYDNRSCQNGVPPL